LSFWLYQSPLGEIKEKSFWIRFRGANAGRKLGLARLFSYS
jgi:hypothetical protein